MSKTVAIIQARMGSSRLPGKVLRDLGGRPMLERVIRRAQRAASLDMVAVATTHQPDDDSVAELCRQVGAPVYRGSLFDVLDRYYGAAQAFEAEVIVRLTADCPLIDPEVIDRTVHAFLGRTLSEDFVLSAQGAQQALPPFDFAANRLPPPWGRMYPIGLDTEVCRFEGLETVWKEATEKHQREHVMPFFYEHLDRFRVLLVNHPHNFGSLRWTVDTPEDLALLQAVYARFGGRDDFSWLEVVELFTREPQLAAVNAGVQHKDYRQVDERTQGDSNQ
jgi:spore coat polysaccharide biosynthesis protein SpsF